MGQVKQILYSLQNRFLGKSQSLPPCGAEKNRRAARLLDFFRPLRMLRLAASATGGARLRIPRTATPSRTGPFGISELSPAPLRQQRRHQRQVGVPLAHLQKRRDLRPAAGGRPARQVIHLPQRGIRQQLRQCFQQGGVARPVLFPMGLPPLSPGRGSPWPARPASPRPRHSAFARRGPSAGRRRFRGCPAPQQRPVQLLLGVAGRQSLIRRRQSAGAAGGRV